MDRSSHQRCFIRKGVLKNFAKFTPKHLCLSLFFNKVAGLRHVNMFCTEHFWWLLLNGLRSFPRDVFRTLPNIFDGGYRRKYRSSHQRCSIKKVVLKNFAKFSGKHLYRSLFLNQVAGTGVFLWILQNSKNTFFTERLWTTASGKYSTAKSL